MMTGQVFERRMLLVWASAAAITFFVTLIATTTVPPVVTSSESYSPSARSISSIGHLLFIEFLRAQGITVVTNEYIDEESMDGNVVVLAEPWTGKSHLAHIQEIAGQAPSTILILPKFQGTSHAERRGWVQSVTLIDVETVKSVLATVDGSAAIVRTEQQLTGGIGLPTPATLMRPQLIDSSEIRPLVSFPEGVLIGEYRRDGQSVIVVSDPDLVANHGIGRGGNAQIILDIVNQYRAPDGLVIYDESIHREIVERPHPLALLFQLPTVLLTLQVVLAFALIAWCGLGRFGAPHPLASTLRVGKQDLIQNIAGLLVEANQTRHITRKYVAAIIDDLGRRQYGTQGADVAELALKLDARARMYGTSANFTMLLKEVEAASTISARNNSAWVRIAQAAFNWKEELSHGPGDRSGDRR